MMDIWAPSPSSSLSPFAQCCFIMLYKFDSAILFRLFAKYKGKDQQSKQMKEYYKKLRPSHAVIHALASCFISATRSHMHCLGVSGHRKGFWGIRRWLEESVVAPMPAQLHGGGGRQAAAQKSDPAGSTACTGEVAAARWYQLSPGSSDACCKNAARRTGGR